MKVKDFISLLNKCNQDARINITVISKTDTFSLELENDNVDIDYDYDDNDNLMYSIEIHANDLISVE